ncbi:MAG: DUF1800 domain-containing protein [Pararhodobacter sp.]|nr:DUF1800 domain-containing protein [Pararhodobacter sp.]
MTQGDTILAIRFGFGWRAGQVPAAWPGGQLDGPDTMERRYPGPDTASLLSRHRHLVQRRRAAGPDDPESDAIRRALVHDDTAAVQRMIARALDSPAPYRERLVHFWADHFALRAMPRILRPAVSAFGDETIRPHVTGHFRDMLRAAILHPMMLRYLDQPRSVGPNSPAGRRRGLGLNENLAREVLELHTLGAQGPYDQQDVHQLAGLMTGMIVDADGRTAFAEARAEPGSFVVLGRRYGGSGQPRLADIEAVLDDLAAHPHTARHLAHKLAVHFVADTPPAALVDDLAALWQASEGDLRAVSAALASHPLARSDRLVKARKPLDFLIAGLAALNVTAPEVMRWRQGMVRRVVLHPLIGMGQPWQEPRGPDGWPEGFDAWITPQGLATRIDWAMTAPPRLRRRLPDARAFVDQALGPLADDHLRRLVAGAENQAEGVGLLLAAPAFNRR